MDIARAKDPMIQANCRTRFTADDFDFIVRTLGRSRDNAVALSELLSDANARDAVLDHQLLVQAILEQPAHLAISPQLYFYVLTRHVLKETGINDLKIADYIASLLEAFSRTARMKSPCEGGNPVEYVSDMLLALRDASPAQSFLLRAHVGNFSLFISGIFHENVHCRSQRGAPDFSFYEDIGSMNYRVVSTHAVARSCELSDIYEALAEKFRDIRLALNRLSESLLNLDDNNFSPTLLT